MQMAILASSEHAKQLPELSFSGKRDGLLDIIFQDHPDGLFYAEGDELYPIFMQNLPDGITAAAGVQKKSSPRRVLTYLSGACILYSKRTFRLDMRLYLPEGICLPAAQAYSFLLAEHGFGSVWCATETGSFTG